MWVVYFKETVYTFNINVHHLNFVKTAFFQLMQRRGKHFHTLTEQLLSPFIYTRYLELLLRNYNHVLQKGFCSRLSGRPWPSPSAVRNTSPRTHTNAGCTHRVVFHNLLPGFFLPPIGTQIEKRLTREKRVLLDYNRWEGHTSLSILIYHTGCALTCRATMWKTFAEWPPTPSRSTVRSETHTTYVYLKTFESTFEDDDPTQWRLFHRIYTSN